MAWNLALLGASGSAAEKYWISTSGSSTSQYGQSVAVDSSGNVYTTGYSNESNTEGLLVKQGPDGLIKWQRLISGSATEFPNAVKVDNSGNVYVTGYSNSTGSPSGDNIFIIKYNSEGVVQWQRTIGGNGNEEGFGLAFDSNNDLYICANTNSVGQAEQNFLLVKLSSVNGTGIWERSLGGSSSEYPYSVTVDSSNSVYVTGYSNSTGSGGADIVLAKYTSSGDLNWQKVLTSSGTDVARGVATDSSGSVYIGGYTLAPNSTNGAYLAKYNSSGTLQWQRVLYGSSTDVIQSVAVDSLNNVYIAGYTYSIAGTGAEFLIAKYDSAGTIQWQRRLGGPSTDIGNGIAIDSKNNLYVAGWTSSTGEGSADFMIAKLPSDGSLTGTYILDGVGVSYAASTLTEGAASLTSSDGGLTATSHTLTNQPGNLSSTTSSMVSYITEGAPSISWVTSADLPVAQRTVAYTTTIVAAVESMSTTVSYQIISGSLPTGLSLNTSTGVISGASTSTIGNVASFTVRATSSKGFTSDRTFNIPTVMAYKISNVDVINVSPYTEQYYVITSSRSVTVNSSISNCGIVMVGGGASGTFDSGSTSTQGGRGGTVYTTSGVSISAQTTNVTVGAGGGMSFSTSSNPGGTTSAFGWSAGGGSGSSGGAGANGSNAGASIMTVVAPYIFDSSTLSQYPGLSTGYLGGWGAGGTSSTTPLQGGLGGGGRGISCGQNPTSGAYLSGGGGGGGGNAAGCGNSSVGSNGGDGLIVIRIPNQ